VDLRYRDDQLVVRDAVREFVRAELHRQGVVTAADLRDLADRSVGEVAGVGTHRQQPSTAKGTVFLNLEDETGLVNVICAKGVWKRFRIVARGAPALRVRGVLEKHQGVINLVAGSDRYPYRRFLLYDIAGETLGAIMPLLLGYLFGASWEAIGDLLGATSTLVLALFLVIVFTSLLVRMLKRSRARRIALTLQSIGPIDETMDQEIVSSKTSPLLP